MKLNFTLSTLVFSDKLLCTYFKSSLLLNKKNKIYFCYICSFPVINCNPSMLHDKSFNFPLCSFLVKS